MAPALQKVSRLLPLLVSPVFCECPIQQRDPTPFPKPSHFALQEFSKMQAEFVQHKKMLVEMKAGLEYITEKVGVFQERLDSIS